MAKPITIKITGDATGFQKALGQTEAGLTSFAKGAGKILVGVGAAAATATAAIGAGLFKLGSDLDATYDSIVIGTGAAGETLEALKDDFRAVAKEVPSNLGDVGQAIADVNTRLGLTGEPLREVTERFLDLSRITKTDLQSNIADMTRVFGDWGVATDDQAATLDKLFFVSQATGIGLDRLSQTVVQYGAPFRQLGFSFEEAAALMGKFEKEGVNLETVMSGLRMGLGKMAKAGEEPIETFGRIVEEIQNAGSVGEANALALAAFGQRAGPDMAAAIREGRFEISDLVSMMDGAAGSIEDAASRTESAGEHFSQFKNRVTLALEPIATLVFNKVGKAFEAAGPYIERFAQTASVWLQTRAIPAIQKLVDFAQAHLPRVREIFGNVMTAVRTAVETAVTWVRDNWPRIAEIFSQVGEVVQTVVGAVVGAVQWFVDLFKAGSDETESNGQKLGEVFTALWETVQTAFTAIQTVIQTVVKVVTAIWQRWGDEITAVAKRLVTYVLDQMRTLLNALRAVFDLIKAVLTGKWGEAWDAVKRIMGSARTFLTNAAGLVKDGIVGAFKNLGSLLRTAVTGAFNAVREWIVNRVQSFTSAGASLGRAIVNGLKNALSGLASIGTTIGNGLINAFKSAWNSVARFINDKIPDKISIPGPFPDIDLPDNPVPTFALGGVMGRSGFARVGERGPETVFLPSGARVVPNHAAPGGGDVHVNVQTSADPWEVGREVAWALKTAGV